MCNNNNNNNLLTAIGLLPGGSGFVHVYNYVKGSKNLKPVGLREKHAGAAWGLGETSQHSLIDRHRETNKKPVPRWPVAGPSVHNVSINGAFTLHSQIFA